MDQTQAHDKYQRNRSVTEELVCRARNGAMRLEHEVACDAGGRCGDQAAERVAEIDEAQERVDGNAKQEAYAHAGACHEAASMVMRGRCHCGGL